MFLAREPASVWANYELNRTLAVVGIQDPTIVEHPLPRGSEFCAYSGGPENRPWRWAFLDVARCCSTCSAMLGVHLQAWYPIGRFYHGCGTSNGSWVLARYVEAAVGRHISRRWALNSRFYRAMKMSRLINTSGSRSHSRTSLPPPLSPRYPHRDSPFSLFLFLLHPTGGTKEEHSSVDCSACFFSFFLSVRE